MYRANFENHLDYVQDYSSSPVLSGKKSTPFGVLSKKRHQTGARKNDRRPVVEPSTSRTKSWYIWAPAAKPCRSHWLCSSAEGAARY